MVKRNVLPFKLQRTDDLITAHAGLVLAHEFHPALKLDRLLDELMAPPGSRLREAAETVHTFGQGKESFHQPLLFA